MFTCYVCHTQTDENALQNVNEDTFDKVVDVHSLIHCTGTDEMFDADDTVVVCQKCIDKV